MNIDFWDIDEVQNEFKDVKEKWGSKYQSRRETYLEDLNTEQRQVHDMMVMACLQYMNKFSTYYGNEIGRHQVLPGDGDTVKAFFIDAVVTTLIQRYGWDDDK